MATDPSIILGINPQPDQAQNLMSMYDFAQKATVQRQAMQAQNALKQVFADPTSLDENGLPTSNALRKVSAIDPTIGMKLYDNVATIQDQRAQRDVAQGKLVEQKSQYYADTVLIPAQQAYDDTLKATGNKDAAIKAGQDVMNAGRKQVAQAGWHSDDELAQHDTTFDPVKVGSQLTQFSDWRAEKKADEAAALAAARQAEIDKRDTERLSLEDRQEQEREKHDDATEALANRRIAVTVNNQGAGTPPLDSDAIDYAATMYRDKGMLPPLGMGKAAAGLRAQIIERAAEMAKAGGGSAAGDIATQAGVKADTAGLANLGKMRASVAQAEGNARKEADLTLSLLDKGGLPGGPSAFGKWVQGARVGTFNDPDASAFQTAVESLKNEYVKVLSTQGGMSGGMSSDAARREADQYINPRLSKAQIKANIDVMRKSMANRTQAIEEAYGQTQDRLKHTGQAAPAPSGGWSIVSVK